MTGWPLLLFAFTITTTMLVATSAIWSLAAIAVKRLDRRGIEVELKIEPRDCWVGLFWDRRNDGLHLYVCAIPASSYT